MTTAVVWFSKSVQRRVRKVLRIFLITSVVVVSHVRSLVQNTPSGPMVTKTDTLVAAKKKYTTVERSLLFG